MTTGVLVSRLNISRQGQRLFFEVLIPADTFSIIGFEVSVTNMQGVSPGETSRLAGSMTVQADNATNLCYSAEVVYGNSTLEYAVLGFPGTTNPQLEMLWNSLWSGSSYREAERVRISNCSILYVSYVDEIGVWLGADIHYTIALYTWIERTE